MIKVHVQLDNRWAKVGTVQTCGYGFDADRLLVGADLATHFMVNSVSELCARLQRLSGSFACVTQIGHAVALGVDRIRSRPLFYCIQNDHLFVSDDVHWIVAQVGVVEPIEAVLAEFLLSGYVTGQETLHPKVRQVRAGELVLVEPGRGELQVQAQYYYRYLNNAQGKAEQDELIASWDRVLLDSFTRLVHSAAGRPLVVPLSGGYDSRLICLMLARLEYRNVITFSYGATGSREPVVAKYVAGRLGFPWHFVEYTNQKWAECSQTSEYQEYLRFAGAFSSLPHVQDWPAVWELKHRGLIPPDGVIVPGHTGDFIGGSHIPIEWKDRRQVEAEQVVAQVRQRHYALWTMKSLSSLRNWSADLASVDIELSQRIKEQISPLDVKSTSDAASAFEFWEWQERQAKFIVNSVRVYDFLGFDWRLPLWDSAVMDFWAQVPLELRFEKRLYDQYIEKVQGDLGAMDGHGDKTQRLRDFIRNSGLYHIARFLLRRGKAVAWSREYENHPMRWYGQIPRGVFQRLYTGAQDINSFLGATQLYSLSDQTVKDSHIL